MQNKQLKWELGARMDQLALLPEVVAGLTMATREAVCLYVVEYMAETQSEREFTIGMVIDAYKAALAAYKVTVELADD